MQYVPELCKIIDQRTIISTDASRYQWLSNMTAALIKYVYILLNITYNITSILLMKPTQLYENNDV